MGKQLASCKVFTYYGGHCHLYKDNPRTSCSVLSGPPNIDVEQCLVGSVDDAGCGAFVEEECEFLGKETSFTAQPGEIIKETECEDYCKNAAEFGGCNYWVYNYTSQVCHTLDSDKRYCWGLSGAENPEIQVCIPCEENAQIFQAGEYFDLQPLEVSVCENSTWDLSAGDDGNEVWSMNNTCASMALSNNIYLDVEFNGSFTALDTDDDWIGFVFGYEDEGHFYLVLGPGAWDTHVDYSLDDWRLVKVESETGTTTKDMMAAILSGEDVPGQTKVVYRPGVKGWYSGKVYSWRVTYRPTINHLEITVMDDGLELWSNTWESFEHELYTGKLGLFSDSQPTKFSDLSVTELCYL